MCSCTSKVGKITNPVSLFCYGTWLNTCMTKKIKPKNQANLAGTRRFYMKKKIGTQICINEDSKTWVVQAYIHTLNHPRLICNTWMYRKNTKGPCEHYLLNACYFSVIQILDFSSLHTLHRKCINVILPLVARVSISFRRLSKRKPTAWPAMKQQEYYFLIEMII